MIDLAASSLSELADHVEQTHHTYLRSELPRLEEIAAKVVSIHGDKDPRLHKVRETFLALKAELSSHMMKEERILFPMVRELEASDEAPMFHCGTLANPIRQMEMEHDQADSALVQLRELTDGFTIPEGACDTYQDMLNALARFEQDLREHIHKESEALFPRALQMEQEKSAGPQAG